MMFGKRLASLRKQLNLSQYQLAEQLDFSRGQLANYEQGKRQPDFATLLKIADHFGVSVDYLLCRPNAIKEAPSSYHTREMKEDPLKEQLDVLLSDPETRAFIEDYLKASNKRKRQMREYMRFLLEQENR